jgi:hypothetical protein
MAKRRNGYKPSQHQKQHQKQHPQQSGRSQKPVPCHICNKIGHIAENCWENQNSPNYRPEKSGTKIDTHDPEVLPDYDDQERSDRYHIENLKQQNEALLRALQGSAFEFYLQLVPGRDPEVAKRLKIFDDTIATYFDITAIASRAMLAKYGYDTNKLQARHESDVLTLKQQLMNAFVEIHTKMPAKVASLIQVNPAEDDGLEQDAREIIQKAKWDPDKINQLIATYIVTKAIGVTEESVSLQLQICRWDWRHALELFVSHITRITQKYGLSAAEVTTISNDSAWLEGNIKRTIKDRLVSELAQIHDLPVEKISSVCKEVKWNKQMASQKIGKQLLTMSNWNYGETKKFIIAWFAKIDDLNLDDKWVIKKILDLVNWNLPQAQTLYHEYRKTGFPYQAYCFDGSDE